MAIKLLIVDDHTIFRMGLKQVLSEVKPFQVVGEASDGNIAIEKARALKPHLVIMDLWMPNCDGIEATRRLQAEMPEIHILVLTISDKDPDLFGAIKAGARGYLLKDEQPDQIIQAIQYVAQGGVIISPRLATKLLSEFKTPQPSNLAGGTSALSQREQEVLRLVARGETNKEIAGRLFISENTAKTYMRNIMDKLHLVNRSQAAAYAASTGMISGKERPRS